MATKSISQLDTAESLALGDLFEIAIPDGNNATGYSSRKTSLTNIADFTQSTAANNDLDTTAKTIVGAINEVDAEGVKWEEENYLGSKNLLPYPYEESNKTVGTFEFTDNGDGTITLNGTAPSNLRYYIDETLANPINYPLKGGYVYKFTRGYTEQTNAYIFIRCYYTPELSNTYSVLVELHDEDKLIDLTDYPIIYGIRVGIVVARDTVVDHITFKPMIRLSSIQDETWEPYAMTSYGLTKQKTNKDSIATTETTGTASRAYTAGEYMFWRNGFYKVTAPISANGAITPGTNVTQTTIGAELKALFDALS